MFFASSTQSTCDVVYASEDPGAQLQGIEVHVRDFASNAQPEAGHSNSQEESPSSATSTPPNTHTPALPVAPSAQSAAGSRGAAVAIISDAVRSDDVVPPDSPRRQVRFSSRSPSPTPIYPPAPSIPTILMPVPMMPYFGGPTHPATIAPAAPSYPSPSSTPMPAIPPDSYEPSSPLPNHAPSSPWASAPIGVPMPTPMVQDASGIHHPLLIAPASPQYTPPSSPTQRVALEPEKLAPPKPLRFDYIYLYPTTPKNRDIRPPEIPWEASKLTLTPYDRELRVPTSVEGWLTFIHPRGAPYYFHEQSFIITDSDMRDENMRRVIFHFYSLLQARATSHRVPFPFGTHLCMHLRVISTSEARCSYYFIDAEPRNLFWLEEFKFDDLLLDVKGPVEKHHFRESVVIYSSFSGFHVMTARIPHGCFVLEAL